MTRCAQLYDPGRPSGIIFLAVVVLSVLTGCRENRSQVAVGTLERHRIELRAERQEPILRLAVREGDRVSAGDVLVELDRLRLNAEMDQAKAGRDLAAARLAELLRGTRREEIEEARARLAESEADLAVRQTDLDRVQNLVADQVEAQSVLDAALAARASASARLAANRAALERLLNGATAEELDQRRADLARSEAEMGKLAIDIERMTVTAPRGGTVDALPFRVGDEPPVGSVVVVLLADSAPFARVYLPSDVRPSVKSGLPATVTVQGFPTPFEGQVRLVSSEAAFTPYYALTERDRSHLTYLAEIDLVNEAALELPTGLPVEVTF